MAVAETDIMKAIFLFCATIDLIILGGCLIYGKVTRNTHTHTHSHSLTLALTLTHTHTHSHSHSHSPSYTHTIRPSTRPSKS